MIRQAVILFTFLASVYFFKLIFLPKAVILLMTFGSTVLMALVIIINVIYDSGKKYFYQNFKFEIILMLLAITLGMFGARFGHGQSFLLSAWAQMSMYFYLFYFFLHALRVPPGKLENLMLIVSILWMFFYIAQYVSYPRMLFNGRAEEARGTIRIFIYGGSFASVFFLYFMHSFFRTYKKIYLIYCVVFLGITILNATRSSLAVFLFIIVIYVLYSKEIKSRIGVIFLLLIGAVLFFFIFEDIIVTLLEVSKDQSAQEGDDIRERATKFFLTEFYPGSLYYFTGNGVSHMACPYGLKVWYYKHAFGYYQSDLGTLGSFTQFGVLYVLSIILIIRKIFIIKLEPKYAWIRYYSIFLSANVLLGEPFANPDYIVAIMAIAYIVDVSSFEYNDSLVKIKEEQNVFLNSKK